jgi:NIPSNAP
MERRAFLTSTLGATVMAAAGKASEAGQGGGGAPSPEYYGWRQYILRNGTQPRRLAEFLQHAAIPALNRLGHKPVGVFEVTFGLPTPCVFVLTPSSSLDALAGIEAGLEKDDAYTKAADGYFNAPATDPVYARQEVSLLRAFPNVPRIEAPAAAATQGPRMFELRTYESHNESAGLKKIEMFEKAGELAIFRRLGLAPVFFGRDIVGSRMPSLTYMVAFPDMAAREKGWATFGEDPEWVKLRSTAGYANADIMTNITMQLLRPTDYSQI